MAAHDNNRPNQASSSLGEGPKASAAVIMDLTPMYIQQTMHLILVGNFGLCNNLWKLGLKILTNKELELFTFVNILNVDFFATDIKFLVYPSHARDFLSRVCYQQSLAWSSQPAYSTTYVQILQG